MTKPLVLFLAFVTTCSAWGGPASPNPVVPVVNSDEFWTDPDPTTQASVFLLKLARTRGNTRSVSRAISETLTSFSKQNFDTLKDYLPPQHMKQLIDIQRGANRGRRLSDWLIYGDVGRRLDIVRTYPPEWNKRAAEALMNSELVAEALKQTDRIGEQWYPSDEFLYRNTKSEGTAPRGQMDILSFFNHARSSLSLTGPLLIGSYSMMGIQLLPNNRARFVELRTFGFGEPLKLIQIGDVFTAADLKLAYAELARIAKGGSDFDFLIGFHQRLYTDPQTMFETASSQFPLKVSSIQPDQGLRKKVDPVYKIVRRGDNSLIFMKELDISTIVTSVSKLFRDYDVTVLRPIGSQLDARKTNSCENLFTAFH